MNLLSLDLSLSVGAAFAIFALGLMAWWRNRWSRVSLLFALMAFTLSFWTATRWFVDLQVSALPDQLIGWRMLFYFSVALAPALALHASSILAHRPFRIKGALSYVISISLFALLDSAFLLRATGPTGRLGTFLLEYAALIGLCYYVITIVIVAANLYPIHFSSQRDKLERRRSVYGTLMLIFYLMAGMQQFFTAPVAPEHLVTAFAAAFFVVSAFGFIRVRLLNVSFSAIDAFFLVLFSGLIVNVLHAETRPEAITAAIIAVVIGAFGILAIVSVRRSSHQQRTLERVNQDLATLNDSNMDFIAIIAHQLRSPLGGIRFASDMLARGDYGPLPKEARGVVSLIRNATDRLLGLSESSLNAARVESGVFQPEPTEINPAAEIRMLIAEVKPFARAKGVHLEASFQDIPERVVMDREVLRNAVFNVIDNAIKYTRRGAVTVEGHTEDGRLILTVTDTGAGIPDEELPLIFDRFQRGEAGKEHHHDGTGLGLYVARKLVEAAGGTLTARSEGRGRGSCFTMTLPIS